MPYIPNKKRAYLNGRINEIIDIMCQKRYFDKSETNGALAYVIMKLVIEYSGRRKKEWDSLSDIIKILDAVKEEYKITILNPYEKEKRKENGGIRCSQKLLKDVIK